MKRPLLVVAVGYIIGIVWGLYCNCSIALLYSIIIPICLLIKLIYKFKNKFKLFSFKRYFRYIKIFLKFDVILTIIISSVISNIIVINQNNKYDNLYKSISEEIVVTGVIVSNAKQKDNKEVYKIKVETINGKTNFRNTYLLVNIKSNTGVDTEYGNKLKIKGDFVHPEAQRNYKGFDYKEFLKTQKVYGTVKASKVEVMAKKQLNPLLQLSNEMFLRIKQNVQNVFPETTSGLFLGVMLGYTDKLDEDIKQSFRDSSIAHILAVSGMHISYIIIGLMFALKSVLREKKKQNNYNLNINFIYVYNRAFAFCCKSNYNGSYNVRRGNSAQKKRCMDIYCCINTHNFNL